MSSGTKRARADAIASAERFRVLFAGTYARWEIAGSIRRLRDEVGDCEHVVDCGGDPAALWKRMDGLLSIEFMGQMGEGVLTKAVYPDGTNRYGPLYRGVMFEGFRHEVFTASALNWGAILTIRTGSADFSRRMVTQLAAGGEYRQDKGVVWNRHGEIVPCRDERAFFELCGEKWREPRERVA